MWPFNSNPVTPPKVHTDTVLPLHHQDDNLIYRSIFINVMMRFDLVLDPDQLRASLEKLLDRDGWNKFGARLRLNVRCILGVHGCVILMAMSRVTVNLNIMYQPNSTKSDAALGIPEWNIRLGSTSISWHLSYPRPRCDPQSLLAPLTFRA